MNSMNDLLSKIDSLEKQITLVQNNVNFSLTITWTILAVVVAVIGVALYFLAKTWFNYRFTQEASKIDDKIKNYVKENPQVFFEKGTGIAVGTLNPDGSMKMYMYIGVKNNISENLIIFSEFSLIKGGRKIAIKEDEMRISGQTVCVTVTNHNKDNLLEGGDTIEYIIIWENPLYKNLS